MQPDQNHCVVTFFFLGKGTLRYNWAIEGYNRLKGKDFALKESATMKLAKTDYRSSTDSTRAFINDKLKTADNPDKRLKFGDLYELYRGYCQSGEKRDIEAKATFRKALEDMKYIVDNSKKDGNQLYIFNVELKTDQDKEEDKEDNLTV
jgi:putative DNA primase/helicase